MKLSSWKSDDHGRADYNGAPWSFRHALSHGQPVIFPRWGLVDVGITLVVTLVITLVFTVAQIAFHIDPMNGWGLIGSATAQWLGLVGWPIIAARRKGNGARIDYGLVAFREQIRFAVLAGVLSLLAAGLVASVLTQFTGPIQSVAGDLALKQSGIPMVFFALMIVFGAPIVEEIAFRGLLFGALCKAGVAPIATVFITAAAFAGFHFEAQRFPVLFAIGLLLGEVRRRTGSTLASIVTHMVNNAPGAIAILLAPFTSLW
ncbi:MAG: CPBP family intramembrane metalloprotease [Actinobacteria bacterium]|uniref:Unannotated protein n=1 Tax=freshwater metagenome TaxID=449393 RepID=A0A6J5YNE3_9ZZZZ|nr:CPBP family intramembrane metalloprotease [Actinomycetota bacterium]